MSQVPESIVTAPTNDRRGPDPPPTRLVVYSPDAPPRAVLLVGRARLDREDGAGGPIRDSRLSRRHAAFRQLANGGWEVTDRGSRNGTAVNGRSIKRRLLAHGDIVRAGDTIAIFEVLMPGVDVTNAAESAEVRTPTRRPRHRQRPSETRRRVVSPGERSRR